jgi:hypothetical protein
VQRKTVVTGVAMAAVMIGGAYAAYQIAVAERTAAARPPECLIDEAIPAEARLPMEQAAEGFAADVFKGDISAARVRFASGSEYRVGRGEFERAVADIRASGPFREPDAVAAYSLTRRGWATQAKCGPDGDPRAATVQLRGGRQRAVVVVAAPMGRDEAALTVAMVWRNAGWEVDGFSFHKIRQGGKSGLDLWREAKAERAARRLFNAQLFYEAAGRLMGRGPDLRLAVADQFEQDRKSFIEAPLGQSGELTVFADDSLSVGVPLGEVGVHVRPDGAYEAVAEYAAPAGDAEAVRRENRSRAELLDRRFPEWRTTFAALAIRGLKPDRTGWETIYDRKARLGGAAN